MRHKSIGMFHAAIDHTPNSDAVGKRQDGGGGWRGGGRRQAKRGRVERRQRRVTGQKEGREKGTCKRKARMQYCFTHMHMYRKRESELSQVQLVSCALSSISTRTYTCTCILHSLALLQLYD